MFGVIVDNTLDEMFNIKTSVYTPSSLCPDLQPNNTTVCLEYKNINGSNQHMLFPVNPSRGQHYFTQILLNTLVLFILSLSSAVFCSTNLWLSLAYQIDTSLSYSIRNPPHIQSGENLQFSITCGFDSKLYSCQNVDILLFQWC